MLSLRRGRVLVNAITALVCFVIVVGSGLILAGSKDTDDIAVTSENSDRLSDALAGGLEALPVLLATVLLVLCVPWGAIATYRLLASLPRTYFDPTTQTIRQGKQRFKFDEVGGFEATRHWVGVRILFIPIGVPVSVKLCIIKRESIKANIPGTKITLFEHVPEVTIRLYGPLTPTNWASRQLREEILSVIDPDGSILWQPHAGRGIPLHRNAD
ncbi:MAG: hypothetical protein FWF02_03205 [Micrococcales bacterium]|nr:hypothetical protein [Micrococcales bacterium]MCL2666695.1 hypothetical protein [Micrococcales bacterium]